MELAAMSIKIEIPDPPSEEPESYCRFCYSKEYDLVSIFPATGLPLQHIIDLLDTLTGIQLNVTEDLPSAICSQCLSKLQEFDHFRRKCNIYNDEIKRIRIQWKDCQPVYVKNEDISDQVQGFSQANETIYDGQHVKLKELSPKVATGRPKNRRKRTRNKTSNSKPLKIKLKKLSSIKGEKQKRKVEEKDYRCRICLEFFMDIRSMNVHLISHTDTTSRRCLKCFRTFGTGQGLAVHMRISYVQTSFSCKYCDVLFKTKETLFAHELYCDQDPRKYDTPETPTKPYQCPECQHSFDILNRLQTHMRLHDLMFPCDKCGVDLPSALLLSKHNERYHSNREDEIAAVVRCEPCQRTFVDVSAYRSHNTRFHQRQESLKPGEDKRYECDQCGKRFWSINTIRYHVLVHRQYRDCDQCAESFRSEQDLREHKLTAHSVKCEFCPTHFSSKQACRSHTTTKHGMLQVKILAEDDEKMTYEWRKLVFKCAICGQDYNKYRELQDHNGRMHPGSDLQIKCLYCDRNSTSRIGYMGHLTRNCGKTPKKKQAWN